MEQYSYAEAAVKRKPGVKTYAAKGGIIGGIVLLFVLMFLTRMTILFPLLAAVIAIAVYCFPKFDMEYEVIFCDGQFDFDRIAGKRKTLLKLDMEDIEIIAPYGHAELDNFKNIQAIKKDYSSGDMKNVYVIIGGSGEKRYRVLFEPTEKMMECIRFKAPSKVKRKM